MKNFLKTAAHQHKDPQVRLEYIQHLDASEPDAQQIVTALARDDADLHVRTAAIAKTDDLTLLRELLGANGDDAAQVMEMAESRLLLKLNQGEVSDIAARALLATHATRLAVPMASQCSVPEQREMALHSLRDESAFVTVVQQSRFHDTRMAAAGQLSHHDALRTALSSVRSRDKEVAKLLQQKIDAAAAAEAALIARRHAISTTLKSAQDLGTGIWTPHHAGRLLAVRDRWSTLAAEDRAEYAEQFDAAIATAETRLEEYKKKQAQIEQESAAHTQDSGHISNEVEKQKSHAVDALATSGADADAPAIAPVVDEALDVVLEKLADSPVSELPERLERLQQGVDTRELASSDYVLQVFSYGQSVAVLFDPPYELNKARPGMLQQRMKRVSALLDLPKVLPGIDLSEHAYVKELAEHHNALKDRLGKAQQESSDRIKATHRQFAALTGIIKDGKWGPANSMMRRLQKKFDAMEPRERASLNEKLAHAEKQLAEMADWQDFAARPKLEVLCESMEALPAKELAPEALAKEVRQLQADWKGMGVSRASNELWSRFKAAGDIAYEPCKAWFDTRQKERQLKLDAKAGLCQELEEQVASLAQDTDWKAIVRMVNKAKREWSRNRVHDRKPDKALEARFSAVLKPFEEALTEQYEENAKAKQSLIDKVEAIANGEINQHSANQAKSLLSAWKLVGVMRRKEDQALWETFNAHLGTIFKHQHKVEREKQRAGLEHVYRARDIIKQLKQMSRSDTLDESEVQSLSAEFQALAEFPERDKKFLLRDFRQAQDACSRVQENAGKRRVQAEQQELIRLTELCEQLENAIEHPESAVDTLEEDTLHAWESSDVRLSAEKVSLLLKRRDSALAHRKNGTTPDYAANESSRRNLLIRMEVAAGVETPEDDKSRRMQYQLEHLQQGMTSAGLDDRKTLLDELEKQWMAAGPVRSDITAALNSRYLKAYKR